MQYTDVVKLYTKTVKGLIIFNVYYITVSTVEEMI